MTSQEEIARGDRSKKILEDPEFQRAYEELHSGLLETFERCEIDNDRAIHETKMMLTLLGMFKQVFKKAITNGLKARNDLDFIINQEEASKKR